MDFISYCLFLFIGIVVGSFLGWLLMKRLCRMQIGEQKKGWIGRMIGVVLVAFGASS